MVRPRYCPKFDTVQIVRIRTEMVFGELVV